MSSEAAKILIDAEDLASKKFEEAQVSLDRMAKKAATAINGLKDPTERYTEELADLINMQKLGLLSTEQFAAAQKRLQENLNRSQNSFREIGGRAKATTELVGTLANAMGGSAFGSAASQLAQLTERMSAFSEVSKAGGAGALAFKAGLAAAVGVMAFQFGKAIGDVVFQTAKATREFERAKEAAAELNQELAKSRDKAFANQLEDIELIRDPEEKRAAQEQLLKQLENNVMGVTAQLKASQKAADEWADAWKITGDRKAFAEEAAKQVEIDKQRLAQAKQQRDQLREELSERTRINNEIRAQNEAAEQAEREALRAKEEAARESARIKEEEQRKIQEAAERAAKAQLDAAQRIEDLKKREITRLQEQRIELEQGAEAARAFALEQQGLDRATAKSLAAQQAAIDAIKEQRQEEEREKNKKDKLVQTDLAAVESRLLTRGRTANDPSTKIAQYTKQAADELAKLNRREEMKRNNAPRPITLAEGRV